MSDQRIQKDCKYGKVIMSEQIVFKPSKKTIVNACILGGILLLGMIVCFIAFGHYYVASFSVCSLIGVFGARNILAYCRTIVFNANGIIISFTIFRKEYSWEDIVTKKCFDYKNLKSISRAVIDSKQYSRGAIFSPKTMKNKLTLYPEEYCSIFHPWTCVYINFDNIYHFPQKKLDVLETYVVKEYSFKAQLLEWGIGMEDK